MINDNAARSFIEAANRATRQTGLLDQVNAIAQQAARAARADTSGLQEQVNAMVAGIDTSGLQEQMAAMVAGIDTSGLQEQILAITQPVAQVQIDKLLGLNWNALEEISDRFASSTSWLEVHRQSAVELQRRASEAAELDLTPQVEQLRLTAAAAAKAAPDLLGTTASTELVRSIVEDREGYPEVTLDDVDERIGRALSQAATANSAAGTISSKQEGLGSELLLLVLAVAVDRAVPDRDELLRLIVILVHLIQHLG